MQSTGSGEWSVQHLAKMVGTTSRTLRHYDDIGLLKPSSIGSNGYRRYDQACLLRLQRILLLRDLGLPLAEIHRILDASSEPVRALETHRTYLVAERERLERQIAAVSATINHYERGEPLMAEEMFDGFDHSQYREEVVERWGEQAYRDSGRNWKGMSAEQQRAHLVEHTDVAEKLHAAYLAGQGPEDATVQELVARHYRWVSLFWAPGRDAYMGLGRMYADDPRFAKNYARHLPDGELDGGAEFVRDAIEVYAKEHLS